MPELNLSPTAQQWVNVVLVWIGFGTVTGLIVRSLVPGKEPSGPVGTLLIGITGSTIGPLLVTTIWRFENFNPISPVGLLSAICSAFLLLMLYRFFLIFFHSRDEEIEE